MQPLYSYYYYPRSSMNVIGKKQSDLNLDQYTYPNNLNTALDLIVEAVKDEKEDEIFYNQLMSIAPNEEAKEIIKGIRDDEKKHNQMFRAIYYFLTNHDLSENAARLTSPTHYCDGLKKAVRGETNAVAMYRKILFAMEDEVHQNMLFEIITDEIRHASLFNLLFAMRGC